MMFFESIKLAFKSIWSHKARAILTMLGIIIGVSSVVLIMSLGEGIKKEVKDVIFDFGSDYIYIIPGNIESMTAMSGSTDMTSASLSGNMSNPMSFVSSDIFKKEDVDEIKKIDGVQIVTPMSIVTGYLKLDDKIVSPMIMGVEPDIAKVFEGFDADSGRFIDQKDMDDKSHVIIISRAYADELFGKDNDAIGKKITLINQDKENEYEIIGITKKPETSSMFSAEMDTLALIPYTTAKNDYYDGKDQFFRLGAKAYEGQDIKMISQKIKDNLATRHEEKDYSVLTPEDMMGMLDNIMTLLTTFISAIAAISLVVGGVGIMNIMLVSVTERTREIGLRKAVGATNGVILLQFLIEAIILSVLGGLISLLFVQIGIEVIKHYTSLTPVITWQAVSMSLGVCIGIGLIFGLAPAIQASRKDPIDALRYE